MNTNRFQFYNIIEHLIVVTGKLVKFNLKRIAHKKYEKKNQSKTYLPVFVMIISVPNS